MKNSPIRAFLLVVSLVGYASGEITVVEDKDGWIETYQLSITPAPEPSPLLKYRLSLPDSKRVPGNAAPFYYRALLPLERKVKGVVEKHGEDEYYSWQYLTQTKLSEIPLDKAKDAVSYFEGSIQEALIEATRREYCDWQLGLRQLEGPSSIEFILPEFQESRGLTRFLRQKSRIAIAENRFEDAIDILRINYQLALDVARPPLLVCSLIGIAEAGIGNDSIRELLAQPDSPNLYWALSDLPQPFIDMRDACRFEMGIGTRVFPLLRDAETARRTPDEWNELTRGAMNILEGLGHRDSTKILEKLKGLDMLPAEHPGLQHAQSRLLDWGYDAKKVEEMAAGQILAIYSARIYQKHADAFEAAWSLPFWQSHEAMKKAEANLAAASPLGDSPDREVLPIATVSLPALKAARSAAMRQEREFAALRLIEALRMHAAETGDLPKALGEVKCVPVPLNPATNQPFAYQFDGTTATIVLPQSDGIPANWRYEITLAK